MANQWQSGFLRDDTTGALVVSGGSSGSGGSGVTVLTFDQPGTLTTGTGKGRIRVPTATTIVSVAAVANTAPTGASIKVDVNQNGTTIFTTQANRPAIAISGFASSDAIPDVTVLAAGDVMTVDIDQVGSTIAGADLTVVVEVVMAAPDGSQPDGVSPHTHVIADVTGLQAALDAKLVIASNLSDLASTTTARTNLGLGTAATQATTTFEAVANKDQNSGYAGLNSSGRVPIARLASGTPDGTKFIRDDGTLVAPSGGGGTAYDRKSEQLWRPTASLGSNIPILGSSLNHTNAGLATGRMIFAGGYTLPSGSAIAHLRMVSNVTSSGMTHSWLTILDQSWTLLAVTNDITTDWTADTVRTWDVTLASSGSDRALMFGIVFVYSTTPPSPASVLSISNIMSRTPIICATSFPTTYTTPGALTIGSTFTTPTNFLGQHFFVEVT